MKKRMAPQNHPIKLVSSVFPILMSMLESFFDIRKDSRKLPLSRWSARTRNFVAKNCRRDKNMPTPPQSIINGYCNLWRRACPFSWLWGEQLRFAVHKIRIFSFIPVTVLQGSMTALAVVLSGFMTEAVLNNLSLVGNILIFCVGINLVWPKTIKVANLLPSLLVAVAMTGIL